MEADNTQKKVAPEVEATQSEIVPSGTIEQSENTKFSDILNKIVEEVEVIKSKDYYTGEELLNKKCDAIPCLIEPILQQTGVACIAGSSDTGKSSFLRQLCIAIATKQPDFIGFKINARHNSAIYVSTEDDENPMPVLLKKQCDAYNLQPSEMSGLRFVFDTEDLLQRLENMLQEKPVDLIVIDTFTDLFGGSMNETNKIRSFINDFSQLAVRYKCLFLFLHHCGKRTEELQEPSKHNLLGSQGFEAKMRVVLELRTDYDDKDLKHLCIVKGNYLPAEYKNESYVLFFNDRQLFENTNNRVPFSELKKDRSKKALRQSMENEIVQLKADGLTCEEIGKRYNFDKSTISRIIAKNRNVANELQTQQEETNVQQKLPF